MRVPRSSYRLQITPEFSLNEAREQLEFVAALGADWLYLSPLLEAEPGSQHGYDVVDHSRVDPSRGGDEGLEGLAHAAHASGLGVLVDIVPNHVGVATPAVNRWWWDLLTHGQESRYAEAFDVDWEFANGKVRLPVLGDDSLDALELVSLPDGSAELRYYEHRFPVAPGTADDGADAATVHSRQHYELMFWRRADSELNYRRFFAVTTLAGIRVEVPWVFDESHAEIGRWFSAGLADGIRVDHPDGLADPKGYLDRLAELTGGAYTLVEKILEGRERLPESWETAGGTGYDALGDFDRVLVDPAGETALNRGAGIARAAVAGADVAGAAHADWLALIHDTKRAIADGILRSEVLRLQRDLGRDGVFPDQATASAPIVADALAELLACFPVYRSYLPADGADALAEAERLATEQRPELAPVLRMLGQALADVANSGSIRFQQSSGMVMAKGVEDTAFYRWNRLVSLNEVGGDPAEFSIATAEFHDRQATRQKRSPHSMTTLSTHDTKRGEDVRARIDVFSELPDEWFDTLATLRESASTGDDAFDLLLWQSAIGAWPLDRERLHGYAEKAAREAGDSTSWVAPDRGFEDRMHAAVDAAYDDDRTRAAIEAFVARVRGPGWSNSLSAKLLQLTTTGMPDVYQGSELWETSLVDPDNRRPVDFAERRRLLAELDRGGSGSSNSNSNSTLPTIDETGAAKLLVVSRALRLRRDRPDLFAGYHAVAATGSAAEHVIAFDRGATPLGGGALTVATRLPVGLAAGGGWGDTSILVPRDSTDVFTGAEFAAGPVPLATLLARYPVALLAPAAPPASPHDLETS